MELLSEDVFLSVELEENESIIILLDGERMHLFRQDAYRVKKIICTVRYVIAIVETRHSG